MIIAGMQFQNTIFPQNDSRMCQLNFIHVFWNRRMGIVLLYKTSSIKIKSRIICQKKTKVNCFKLELRLL